MDAIITSIQEKLQEVEELQYIDENWGQLDEYGTHPPVKYPCALIDVVDVRYTDIGIDKRQNTMNRQEGQAQVNIAVANLKLTNTSSKAPLKQKEHAHSIFRVIEKVHASLQGYNPTEYCGALIRTVLKRVQRDDGVQEYFITYSLGLHDV